MIKQTSYGPEVDLLEGLITAMDEAHVYIKKLRKRLRAKPEDLEVQRDLKGWLEDLNKTDRRFFEAALNVHHANNKIIQESR